MLFIVVDSEIEMVLFWVEFLEVVVWEGDGDDLMEGEGVGDRFGLRLGLVVEVVIMRIWSFWLVW